jgi:hypothetical protein
MSLVLKKLTEIVIDLPEESQAEVIDFAEFLRQKNIKTKVKKTSKERVFGMYENETPKQRVAGLNQGEIWMSDDFNDDLGDEFWFGEDFGIIEKNDESVD